MFGCYSVNFGRVPVIFGSAQKTSNHLLLSSEGFESNFVHLINIYGLLTKSEVKMTGYWPSSFFTCLWTETKSRSIN